MADEIGLDSIHRALESLWREWDLLEEESRGEERARLALDVYTYRIRKYVGAYAAGIRERALEDLEFLGVDVDSAANHALEGGREGTFHRGATALLVIGSGEELTIARETERAPSPAPPGDRADH